MVPVRKGQGADAPCPSKKIRFPDMAAAAEEMERVRALRAADPTTEKIERRIYPCESCAGWHMTSTKVIGRGGRQPRRGNRNPHHGRGRRG